MSSEHFTIHAIVPFFIQSAPKVLNSIDMEKKKRNGDNRLKTNYKWEIVGIKNELGDVGVSEGRNMSRAFIRFKNSHWVSV